MCRTMASNVSLEVTYTECPICREEPTDPRLLPCVHAFCLPCLEQYCTSESKLPGDSAPCPVCKTEFRIPKDGAKGLTVRNHEVADPDAEVDADNTFQSQAEELTAAIKVGGVEAGRRMLEDNAEEWKRIPLNVAVIGMSGVGKSSFINSIRGLTAEIKGAAKVGVTEGTGDIRGYSHPNNPLLKFWDLPGVGTLSFPRETYLSTINVDRYDFFLLITASGFTQDDAWLGEEIHQRNKKYFFIRTQMGVDVFKEKTSHPTKHNLEDLIDRIRKATAECLEKEKRNDIPMFLIDSYEKKQFDFEKLERSLIEWFPELKRSALILSLQSTSDGVVKLKVAELRSRIWKVAVTAEVYNRAKPAAVEAAMVAGATLGIAAAAAGKTTLSLAALAGVSIGAGIVIDIDGINIKAVMNEARFYLKELSLDKDSLIRYHATNNEQTLSSYVDEHLRAVEMGSAEDVKKFIKDLCDRASPSAAAALEKYVKWVPVFGQIVASRVTYAGTSQALNLILDEMEKVALEVIKLAAENAAE